MEIHPVLKPQGDKGNLSVSTVSISAQLTIAYQWLFSNSSVS